MILSDMLKTLRARQFERVELRDIEGNEILTSPANSDILIQFKDWKISEWLPHAAPDKDATFTVFIKR